MRPLVTKHIVSYRIAQNFGGRKHWRIWRLGANSPKFYLPKFSITLVFYGYSAQSANVFFRQIHFTVQSSYNFTNSRVATHFHAWLHAKSCRVPRLVAACPTPCPRMVTRKELPCATLSSCVSHAMSTCGHMQKAAVCHA